MSTRVPGLDLQLAEMAKSQSMQKLQLQQLAQTAAIEQEMASSEARNTIMFGRPFSISVIGDSLLAMRFLKQNRPNGQFSWEDEVVRDVDLCRLTLSNIRLVNIGGMLTDFTTLSHLNLSFNRIVDISGLSQLHSVRLLDLSHNRIVSLEALRDLHSLQTLRCHYNAVETLDPLLSLTDMSELWLSNNSIAWNEYIYLLPLVGLRSATISGNPSDKKPKINEFVTALCPSLVYLNGVDCTTQREDDPEFLRSVDGRVMLTQAKSKLSVARRQALEPADLMRLDIESGSSVAHFSTRNGNNGSSSASAAASSSSPSKKSSKLQQNSNSPTKMSAKGGGKGVASKQQQLDEEGQIGEGGQGGNDEDRRLEDGEVALTTVFTSPVPPPSKPKYVSSYAQQSPAPKVEMYRAKKSDFRGSFPKKFMSDTPSMMSPPPVAGGGGSELSKSKSAGSLAPVCIVRFGEGEDASVALCLHADGNGYARWSKGGPVACSLENGRVFSSYRGGSIAVVLDVQGNGSVMDTRGRCVLLTTEGGVAKVMDSKGSKILAEYRRPSPNLIIEAATALAAVAAAEEEAEILRINALESGDEAALEEAALGKQAAEQAASALATRTTKHSWNFDGLNIEFIPSIWELKVKFSNERLQCEFSSLTGGKLIQEYDMPTPKPKKGEGSRASSASGGGGGGGGGKSRRTKSSLLAMQKAEILTESEHEALRENVNSVLTNLNDMLEQLGVNSNSSNNKEKL